MSKPVLTVEALKSVLDYDPETGIFCWKVDRHGGPGNKPIPAGSIAGGLDPYGYRKICIGKRAYRAHRLAWLYVYERWPQGEIDHANGLKDDNRIDNLRAASKQNNQANSKRRSTNTSGFKGIFVMSDGRRKKYGARITVDYENIWLGNFYTPEEAHAAYGEAAVKYFGEFARVS